MPRLRYAGGKNILKGSPDARNFRTCQRRPWIRATQRHIRKSLKAGCWATRLMCDEARRDFTGTLAPFPMHPGKHGTPLDRARDIIGWIIQQGRFSAVDILTVALATDIMVKYWEGTPFRYGEERHTRLPYFRAVQIGKTIHKLLRAEVKVYEHDNGHGSIRREVVRYKKGLTSRYVCQRLQSITEGIYGSYMADNGRAIASQVARREIRQMASRTDYRISRKTTA